VVIQLPIEDLPKGFSDSSAEVFRNNGSAELLSGDVNTTIKALIDADVSLTNMRVRRRTLDDLFIELTGKELRG